MESFSEFNEVHLDVGNFTGKVILQAEQLVANFLFPGKSITYVSSRNMLSS